MPPDPDADRPLRRLGFLTIGLFDATDPGPGHTVTLEMIELGERLGFDSAWLRDRHLQHGISSPVAVLAAASQRTSRIDLGTAVIPLAWENPLRLAEDLATVDVLSGGRLNPGVSVGPPMAWEDVRGSLYPDTADVEDFGYTRVERLLAFVSGEQASTFSGTRGIEVFSDRVQPQSPGLRERMWYGGASLRSATWAGEHAMNFLCSSVVRWEGGVDEPVGGYDFAEIQLAQIRAFRAAHPDGEQARVSQGLVVLPTDTATPGQRDKYEAYAASRLERTPPRRVRGSCSSPSTWWARPRSSPSGCRPTQRSARSRRWRLRCRSPSSPRTTSRSSPTWRRGSDRCSAGSPAQLHQQLHNQAPVDRGSSGPR